MPNQAKDDVYVAPKKTSVASASKAAAGVSKAKPKASVATAAKSVAKAAAPAAKTIAPREAGPDPFKSSSKSTGAVKSAGSVGGAASSASDPFKTGSVSRAGRAADTATMAKADKVQKGGGLDWSQFQDMLDTLSPSDQSSPFQDQTGAPGSSIDWGRFQQDVHNGSLGVPRAAGYGLDTDPNAPAAEPDMWTRLHDFLQGPYNARVEANGGAAPFEGAVDTAGIYKFLQQPYLDRVAREATAATPATRSVTTVPVAAPAVNSGWVDARARLLTPSRLAPDQIMAKNPGPAPYTPDPSVQADALLPSGEYVSPAVAGIEAAAHGVSLPRADPRGYGGLFSSDGQVTTADGTVLRPGTEAATNAAVTAAAEPSAWDTVVDNAGNLLSHTGLGGIVSTLFPDMWNAGGDMMKGIGIGGATTKYPEDMARALEDPYGDRQRQRRDKTGKDQQSFPDLNHNGIDDRVEGYTGPDTTPTTPSTDPVWDLPPTRVASFPQMPPYNPGRSDEWSYFTNNHLADGGPVYAEGGGIDQSDPRVKLIGDTEDALAKIKGGEKPGPEDVKVLKAFVAQFGDAALKSLNDNVAGGMSMRGGRHIKGPGGPKDDAVPAVIVDKGSVVSPAKLSNGEFVFSVDAVKGIGGGDIEVGAQRMQELADRLSRKGGEIENPSAGVQFADGGLVDPQIAIGDILYRYTTGHIDAKTTQKLLAPFGYKANLRQRLGNEFTLEPLGEGAYIQIGV